MTTDAARRFASLAVHAGQDPDESTGAVIPPVHFSTTFAQDGIGGLRQGYEYGRSGNPTRTALQAQLAAIEGGAHAFSFASGLAAEDALLRAVLVPGDEVLLGNDVYGGTYRLLARVLGPWGVRLRLVDMSDEDAVRAAVAERAPRLLWVETPSNPGLDICDIAAVAKAAHAAGALLIVDNTTMTPFGQRPLDLGADIVVAADTKAPNGHSDVLFGHVASRDPDIITAVQDWRKTSGCIPSPFDAWLVHRGLETLEVRFERMCASAGAIARRLQQHPAVRAVRYPGLENDPSHNLASAQMERFGFLVSLVLESEDKAEDFINGCALMQAATSFGGVHTSAERRTRRGDTVPPGFVRLSVGCEPTEPLWEAIKASLDRLGG